MECGCRTACCRGGPTRRCSAADVKIGASVGWGRNRCAIHRRACPCGHGRRTLNGLGRHGRQVLHGWTGAIEGAGRWLLAVIESELFATLIHGAVGT